MQTEISHSSLAEHPLIIPFLVSLPGLGVSRYWRFRQNGLPLKRLFTQPLETLLPLLPPSSHDGFSDVYRHQGQSRYWLEFLEIHQPLIDQGVEIVTHDDLRYPTLLNNISHPPAVLYIKGNIAALNAPQIAFVGSRHATVNGTQSAVDFARYLASVGFTITSGLALGIDAASHHGALAGEGQTIAVMGTGIDRVYPTRHAVLADKILASGGALVSEFIPGTAPHSGNFPRRNRIISGLSLGVLVVEAAVKSGSLITARYALEQNREVFAIPGSIHNPLSRGCHALIRDGATLVETAQDIAIELSAWAGESGNQAQASVAVSGAMATDPLGLSSDQRLVWRAIEFEPCTVDVLAERTKLATADLLALLMSLELQGLITQAQGVVQRSVRAGA